MLERQADGRVSYSGSTSTAIPKYPKLPPFEDKTDEMDSYLRRFERYAEALHWDKVTWATNLSALLKGKALDVYALLPIEQAMEYDAVKTALLKRYDLTEDGFKSKFRDAKPESGETFSQFSVRLSSYLDRWVSMSKSDQTYEDLYDLMIREQFVSTCNRELALFLKERIPKSIAQMAQLADQYREARPFLSITHLVSSRSSRSTVPHNSSKPREEQLPRKPGGKSDYSDRRCFKCGKHGHIAVDVDLDTEIQIAGIR